MIAVKKYCMRLSYDPKNYADEEGNIHGDRIIVIVALFVWIACMSSIS